MSDKAPRPVGMPDDTPDYMAGAWIGCMQWAIGEPEIREEFEAETGHRYVAPRTPIDKMIDDATGHGTDYVAAFVEWANKNVWGPM